MQVIHVHSGKKGTVIKIEEGCNPVYHVQIEGKEFISILPKQDLAYADKWPNEGCRL